MLTRSTAEHEGLLARIHLTQHQTQVEAKLQSSENELKAKENLIRDKEEQIATLNSKLSAAPSSSPLRPSRPLPPPVWVFLLALLVPPL